MQEHCYCDTCVNYRPVDVVGRVRSDRRCGAAFPLEDGEASECDGASSNPCCSNHGYCGPGPSHCACVGCTDYTGGVPKCASDELLILLLVFMLLLFLLFSCCCSCCYCC